ncbi:MAG TPA: FAD-dependent oxidoreductase, partial [Gaiellaceae bacterium]|nr:FAD-dependent oxidoreductase [Gaiellaceae bacterium]
LGSPPVPPRSLWLREALAAEDGAASPELRGPARADVCVVGGGYTGLWTVLRLKELEPDASVVLVEADVCGGGPSGRNGGFALSWWPKIDTLVKRVGEEEAVRLVRASADAVAELGRFCEREGFDAHFRPSGWLWTATSPAQLGSWEGALSAAESAGEQPFAVLSAEEVQRRAGSPAHLGAVFEAGAATVQPALLARGLRRVAATRGVRIHERSPLVELEREQGVVRTPGGSVEAGAVVLATGAWLAAVPELRPAIVAVSSDMVATEPIPDRLEKAGWTGGEAISNSRLMVHYYRTTRDGRIAFGQGGHRHVFGGRVDDAFFGETPPATRAHLERDLVRLVPFAAGAEVTDAWGGPIDRTADGLPFFGRLPGRVPVVYGAGYSGNGVAPSLLAGRILASSALGRDDEWSGCGLNRGVPGRFPPEPARYLGAFVVRAAVRRKEGREDEGRSVDPVTRKVAGLAPQGFFRVNR